MASLAANAVVSTLVNLLVTAGESTVQNLLSSASATGADFSGQLTNVLNAISQFEGDLTSSTAVDQIIQSLLIDASNNNPLSVTGDLSTFAIKYSSPTQPSDFPLAADGVLDTSSVGFEPLRYLPGQYPYNKTMVSEAGHIHEVDDTPGAERLLTQHTSGTYEELGPDGRRVVKVTGKNYHIVADDDNVYVQGGVNIYIAGATNVNFFNDVNISIGGKLSLIATEDLRIKASEIYFESSNGDINIKSSGNTNIQSANNMSLDSGGSVKIQSSSDTSVLSNANTNITSTVDINLLANSNINQQSAGNLSLNAGNTGYFQTQSDLNIENGGDFIVSSSGMASIQSDDITAIDCADLALNLGETETADDAETALTASPADPALPTNIFTAITRNQDTPATIDSAMDITHVASMENDDVPGTTGNIIDNYHDNRQISTEDHDLIRNAPAPSPTKSATISSSVPAQTLITSTNDVEKNTPNPNLKISKYFTLGQLTTNVAMNKYPVKSQHGLSVQQIIKNLSLLALNSLDAIKDHFPNISVNSGFRSSVNPITQSGNLSNHETGQAADLHFGGFTNSQLLEAATWVAQNIPYYQLIIERSTKTGGYWLHVAFKSGGGKSGSPLLSCGNPGSHSEKYLPGLHIFD